MEKLKENKYQRIHFTKDEVEAICTAAVEVHGRQDLADIVNFAAYTGMRQGEILKLTASRVDFLQNCLHVGARREDTTKTGTYRAVPIHSSLKHMLIERTRDAGARDLVFGYDWKDKDQLLRAFKKVINRYPINLASEDGYCFHSLRHSFGTWHFAAGQNLKSHGDDGSCEHSDNTRLWSCSDEVSSMISTISSVSTAVVKQVFL